MRLGDPKVVSNVFGEKCHPQQSVAKRNPKQWCLGLFELPQLRLLSRTAGVSGDGVPPSLVPSLLKDGSPAAITELYLGWNQRAASIEPSPRF
jgi:hypothetical protein